MAAAVAVPPRKRRSRCGLRPHVVPGRAGRSLDSRAASTHRGHGTRQLRPRGGLASRADRPAGCDDCDPGAGPGQGETGRIGARPPAARGDALAAPAAAAREAPRATGRRPPGSRRRRARVAPLLRPAGPAGRPLAARRRLRGGKRRLGLSRSGPGGPEARRGCDPGRAAARRDVGEEAGEAPLVVTTSHPKLTTERAKSYRDHQGPLLLHTAYAGTYDRIHNLQLAVSLIDGTLVAPSEVFSLNQVVGERTSERGFRVAPVIVGGQYEEDVGGGSHRWRQPSSTPPGKRGSRSSSVTHALYIARYPAGRDAAVNYPNLDLKFLNDTSGYLLVRGGYDNAGISISILGPDTGRRVVSETGPLRDRGAAAGGRP